MEKMLTKALQNAKEKALRATEHAREGEESSSTISRERAESVHEMYLNIKLVEARFVPSCAMQDSFFIIAVRRQGKLSFSKWRRFKTRVLPQEFKAEFNDTFCFPIDDSVMGSLDVTIEWWNVTETETVRVGTKSIVMRKSVDDQWYPIKGGDGQPNSQAAVRLAILMSSHKNVDSSSEMLRRMFSGANSKDKYGAIVPGEHRWEYAIYTSLHMWLEKKQVRLLEAFLSQPIAERQSHEMRELLWGGVPAHYRTQIYLYLTTKSGEAGEHAQAMANHHPRATFSGDAFQTALHRAIQPPPLPADRADAVIQRLLGVGHAARFPGAVVERVISAVAVVHAEACRLPSVWRIAVQLLTVLEEDAAFRILSHLVARYLSHLHEVTSCHHLSTAALVLSDCVRTRFPALADHLDELRIPLPLLLAEWLSALCVGLVPTETHLRLVDVLLYEGLIVLFAAVVALIKVARPGLMAVHDSTSALEILSATARSFFDSSWLLYLAKREFNAWARSIPRQYAATLQEPVNTGLEPKVTAVIQLIDLAPEVTVSTKLKACAHELNLITSLDRIGVTNVHEMLSKSFPAVSDRLVHSISTVFDNSRNKEGWLDLKELLLMTALLSPTESIESALLLCFEALDVNDTGYVDLTQLATVASLISQLRGLGSLSEDLIKGLLVCDAKLADLPTSLDPHAFCNMMMLLPAIPDILMSLPLRSHSPAESAATAPGSSPEGSPHPSQSPERRASPDPHTFVPIAHGVADSDSGSVVVVSECSKTPSAAESDGVVVTSDMVEARDEYVDLGGSEEQGERKIKPELSVVIEEEPVKIHEEQQDQPASDSQTAEDVKPHDCVSDRESGTRIDASTDSGAPLETELVDGVDGTNGVTEERDHAAESNEPTPPPADVLFVSDPSLVRFEGWYECELYDSATKDDVYYVMVRQDGQGGLVWMNKAGVSWGLVPSATEPDCCDVARDCPYRDQTPQFRWQFEEGHPVRVLGPWEEPYEFKGPLS